MKRYKFRDNVISLLGDTHSVEAAYRAVYGKTSCGTDLVHLGDVGLGFGKYEHAYGNALSYLKILNEGCIDKDIRLFLIRGNHDAPWVWEFDNLSNVFLVHEGDTGKFPNGKKALFIGGGISVDRYDRTEGISYWHGEVTNMLDKVSKCDIVFSHDCPEEFNHSTHSLSDKYEYYVDNDKTLIDDCLIQREKIGKIVKASGAKTMFYGHMHNHEIKTVDGVYGRCVNIDELVTFDANREYKDNV